MTWWLQPGWGDACCADCGVNIQSTGGDPDWGRCYECFSRQTARKRTERYTCHVCGEGEAVASVNGIGVCSLECEYSARSAPEPTEAREGGDDA